MTTRERIIEQLLDSIRAEGYVSAMNLAMKSVEFTEAVDIKTEWPDVKRLLNDVGSSPGIHVVEYTNITVSDYRLKDLYYFNPHKKK